MKKTLAEYRRIIPHPSRKQGGQRPEDRPGAPLISVVTVVFNDRDGLQRTIDSVREQTYRNIEFVIIDGGSTDGTLDVMRCHDPVITYWLSEPDEGISDAFNKGLSVVRGKWVLFLNAADVFSAPDSLAVMAEHVGDAPVISGFALSDGKIFPKRILRNSDPIAVRSMLSHQASLVLKDLFETYGVFDTSFRIRMDYEFWLRVLRRERFLFLDRVLVEFAAGGASGSERKKYIIEELRANRKHLGLLGLLSPSRILFYFERYLGTPTTR